VTDGAGLSRALTVACPGRGIAATAAARALGARGSWGSAAHSRAEGSTRFGEPTGAVTTTRAAIPEPTTPEPTTQECATTGTSSEPGCGTSPVKVRGAGRPRGLRSDGGSPGTGRRYPSAAERMAPERGQPPGKAGRPESVLGWPGLPRVRPVPAMRPGWPPWCPGFTSRRVALRHRRIPMAQVLTDADDGHGCAPGRVPLGRRTLWCSATPRNPTRCGTRAAGVRFVAGRRRG